MELAVRLLESDIPHAMSHLDDPGRLAAIRDLGLLDPGSDTVFDRLAALAARVLKVPVALVSVVGSDEQRFLACVTTSGPWEGVQGTPISHSFCRHAIESGEPLVIEDARTHPVLRDNPAIEDLGVVAYAGIPLTTAENHVLGTVCVIDHEPRRWTDEEVELLREVAALALARLELRGEVRRRRRTEEEAGRQADRYRALVEKMDEVISVLDEEGKILYESSSVERILGHDPAHLVGRDAFELIHPDDQEVVRDALVSILQAPGATRIGEVRFRHADGGWRRLEYIAQNLLHVSAVEGIVVNSRDVTERRALEDAARQAEKLDALGRLAGGVAHDFNNILAVIRTNAELALAELEEGAPIGPDLQEIVASVDRGARITKQLLGFSRSKSTDPEVLDPAAVIREMEGLLQRLATDGVEFRTDVESVPSIRIARAELEQVILNLAVNARDAIEADGQVTVTLRGPRPLPERTIPVEQQVHDRYVALAVADTGAGIPEAVRDRIFEPFFTTKPEGEGTGLGLSTVYGVAVRRGGRIGLETAVGVGTTFSVYFPVVEDRADPSAESSSADFPTD